MEVKQIVLNCPVCTAKMEDIGNSFPPILECKKCGKIYCLTTSGLETIDVFNKRHSYA